MKSRTDAYETITNKVIEMMETHGSGWTKPWTDSGLAGAPVSMSTGDAYRGINRFMLMMTPFTDARWGTYKAWQAKGAQVRKGEKGTQVLYFNVIKRTDDATGEEKAFPMAKIYTVFNAEQVEGAPELPKMDLTPTETIAHCEEFIANTGAEIRIGGDQACYSPVTDIVRMPHIDQFDEAVAYYGTALHELVHWTGHKSRCNRDLLNHFGSEDYAKEELVAELGATFLCADLGIEPEVREDHAGYLASWLKALKNDKRLIVRAAKQAQEASEFLHGLQVDQAQAA